MNPSRFIPNTSDNQWAYGCAKCKFGIVSAPPLTRTCELHMERLIQAMAKEIEFCECQAGVRYHIYLKNRYRVLIEEARRTPRWNDYAARGTHPDIEIARDHITLSYAMMPAPSIHLDGEAT